MGKTDHGDNCQGENGGVKTAWGKCLWGFTDRIGPFTKMLPTVFSNDSAC